MFSRSTGYSIEALTYLAGQPSGKLTGAREISAAARVPMPFLSKLLRNLSRHKLLRSFKGVRGGYELARPAEKVTIGEILAATSDEGVVRDLRPCLGTMRRAQFLSPSHGLEVSSWRD
jgi:Rrf2 family protein